MKTPVFTPRQTPAKPFAPVFSLLSLILVALLFQACAVQTYRENWRTELDSYDPRSESGETRSSSQYIMKGDVFSLKHPFYITDINDVPVFSVERNWLCSWYEFSFRDARGRELAFVSQKPWTFTPRWRIFIDKEPRGEVVRKLHLTKAKYVLRTPEGQEYEIKSHLIMDRFEVTRNGHKAGIIQRFFSPFNERIGVEVAPGEDDAMILIAALITLKSPMLGAETEEDDPPFITSPDHLSSIIDLLD